MTPSITARAAAGRAIVASSAGGLQASAERRAGTASSAIATLPEGRGQDAPRGDLVALQAGGGPPLAEHVDPVAVVELLELGRVPDEAAAALRLGADHAVDLLLGADVHAAHRVVQEDDPRVGGEGAGEEDLLLVAAAQAQDRAVDPGGLDLHARGPVLGEPARAARRDQPAVPERAQRADRQVVGDRPVREHAFRLLVARDVGRGRTPAPAVPPGRGGEELAQALALAVPVEAGEAYHLARGGLDRQAGAAGGAHLEQPVPRGLRRPGGARGGGRLDVAHEPDQVSTRGTRRGPLG